MTARDIHQSWRHPFRDAEDPWKIPPEDCGYPRPLDELQEPCPPARPGRAKRTPERLEMARQKRARTREAEAICGGLREVAELVVKQARHLELHAAKNQAAGYVHGARNKQVAGK